MAQRVAGTAYLKAGAEQFDLRANLTIHAATFERTGIAGQDGVHGFSEMPRVPAIEADVTTVPGINVKSIQDIKDTTVYATTAWGRVYVLRNAWYAGPADIDTTQGQFKLRFEGMSIQEFEGSAP